MKHLLIGDPHATVEELADVESLFAGIETLLDGVDFVFASSSLQYTTEPLSYLKKLLDVNAKYLVITRTVFNEKDSRIPSSSILPISLPSQKFSKIISVLLEYLLVEHLIIKL